MAATVINTLSSTQTLPGQSRRVRRTHAKTKTGCITCKIRRKKCDETKPACARCTSTGRKCDGYKLPSPANPTSSSNLATPTDTTFPLESSFLSEPPAKRLKHCPTSKSSYPVPLCRGPVLVAFNSDLERHCFDYFRLQTGPQFASYFDSAIWRTFMIQAAMVHPAVLRAAAAVGAVHQRFALGITYQAFEYCAIAQDLQTKALRCLKEEQARSGSYTREVTMMASILHGLFECFQSNYDVAVQHMTNGLRAILNRPMRVTHSETRYCWIQPQPSAFSILFHRLCHRSTQLFGSSPKILCFRDEGKPPPPIPTPFDSLDQARDLLFTEMEWILRAPARLWKSKDERSKAQSLHVTRLLQWSMSYAETIRHLPYRTSNFMKCCLLLKVTRNAAYLMLYLLIYLEGKEEISCPPDTNMDLERKDDADEQVGLSSADRSQVPPISMLNHHLFRITSATSAFAPESLDFDDAEFNEEMQTDSELAVAEKLLGNLIDQREELNTNLTRVCILAESILDETNAFAYDEHSISLDSGIGPPRFPEPSPSSSAKTRHLVKSALVRYDGEEDMWKMLGVYGIAERISALEEHAVVAAVKDFFPPGKYDPKWVDVTCFFDENKLLLRYCRMDDAGTGMLWTQEWLKF